MVGSWGRPYSVENMYHLDGATLVYISQYLPSNTNEHVLGLGLSSSLCHCVSACFSGRSAGQSDVAVLRNLLPQSFSVKREARSARLSGAPRNLSTNGGVYPQDSPAPGSDVLLLHEHGRRQAGVPASLELRCLTSYSSLMQILGGARGSCGGARAGGAL
jgi:hypothetical protein